MIRSELHTLAPDGTWTPEVLDIDTDAMDRRDGMTVLEDSVSHLMKYAGTFDGHRVYHRNGCVAFIAVNPE